MHYTPHYSQLFHIRFCMPFHNDIAHSPYLKHMLHLYYLCTANNTICLPSVHIHQHTPSGHIDYFLGDHLTHAIPPKHPRCKFQHTPHHPFHPFPNDIRLCTPSGHMATLVFALFSFFLSLHATVSKNHHYKHSQQPALQPHSF